ncbi:permease prefix domain 1-containing protein [Paenibacillus sp. ClWae2A]|uniref:permease prefix domain 1-containing protein n=1 Tax=Paenibacillus sp. ClWae2A TaxID=3057177 RepID=UPI0028F684FE|nr:permease prefix domain 1-containing protein [Paenibacillus sp. ClWae2A]MDT9721033.1 permease prefix domain 1-containing protein [Paenibacillus sp. ClWae2A]
MEVIEQYLDQVLRFTFLTKREKSEWREEMAAHLYSSVDHLKRQGLGETEAIERSIQQFGSISELRKTVTKETYGFNMKMIFGCALAGLLLFIVTLAGGLIANRYGVHNRYIELMPIFWITVCALGACLVFTRKRVDRFCLLSVPLLFTLGYLQAYFQVMYHYWGEGLTFNMFEKLFFSGVLHTSGGLKSTLIASMFLSAQALGMFAISKNKYISILPFAFSIMYTFVHMLMFSLYYVFFASEQFSSAVTQGYSVFQDGNMQRVLEMGMSLTMAVALCVVFQGWSYWTAKRKLSSAS